MEVIVEEQIKHYYYYFNLKREDKYKKCSKNRQQNCFLNSIKQYC